MKEVGLAESFITEKDLAAAEGTTGASPARTTGSIGRVSGCGGLGNCDSSDGYWVLGPAR